MSVLRNCYEGILLGLLLMALPGLIWWSLWLLYQVWHALGVM